MNAPCGLPGLIACWDFQDGGPPWRSHGPHDLALHPGGGAPMRVSGGCLGPWCLRLQAGAWLRIPASDAGPLDRAPDGPLTLMAWIRRAPKPDAYCQAIAGMWDEERGQRQYALFLDALGATDRLCAHASATGGNCTGHDHCTSAAIGGTRIGHGRWRQVAMTWDGAVVRVWLDGREDGPPIALTRLHDAGCRRSDFTVGAVARQRQPSGPGNHFSGDLGGLALWDRALAPAELGLLLPPPG